MSNTGWAVVVVVALEIVAIFGYWAIEGDEAGVGRDGTARIESNVNVDRQPAQGGGGKAEVNIDRERPEGSGGDVDVEIREQGSADGGEPQPAR
jgi:hypothetical protein